MNDTQFKDDGRKVVFLTDGRSFTLSEWEKVWDKDNNLDLCIPQSLDTLSKCPSAE